MTPSRFWSPLAAPLVRLTLLLPMAWLSGCAAYNTLYVDDTGPPIVTARALHRFGGPGSGRGGIEAEVHAAHGSSTQTLLAGDGVSLNDRIISGPVAVHNRARAEHLQLAYNHLLFLGSPVEMEWYAGVTVSRLRWDAQSDRTTDPALSYERNWFGPAAGLAARVHLAPTLALELRAGGAIQYHSIVGAMREGAELALTWSPSPALQLRAGVADSRSYIDDLAGNSDISMRVRGPFAGLVLGF